MELYRELLRIRTSLAIAFGGVSAYFGNLLLKFPNFSSLGEKIAFYGSIVAMLFLFIAIASLTLKIRRFAKYDG